MKSQCRKTSNIFSSNLRHSKAVKIVFAASFKDTGKCKYKNIFKVDPCRKT